MPPIVQKFPPDKEIDEATLLWLSKLPNNPFADPYEDDVASIPWIGPEG